MKAASRFLCCAALAAAVLAGTALRRAASPYTIHTPYAYPVVPGTEAWAALGGIGPMAAATRIPEETLANMDTPALLQTVLDHPLIGDLYLYDSLPAGFAAFSRHCNGVPELLSRPDALDVIYAAYQAFPIEPDPGASEQTGCNAFFVQPLLEALLYTASSEADAQTAAAIERTVRQKQTEKDASGQYGISSSIYEKLASGGVFYAARPLSTERRLPAPLFPVIMGPKEVTTP